MDAFLSILGTIVVESGRLLCGSASSMVKDMFKFQVNVKALEDEMISLIQMKNDIKGDIEMAELDGKLRTTQVRKWLRKVQEIEQEVTLMQAKITANKEDGCCLKCSLRYRLSRDVGKKLREVKQIIEDGSFPEGRVMVDYGVRAVEQLPGPSIMSQKRASEILREVMDLLMDDEVGVIGIYGMGGVGKTTLITNLNNQLGTSKAVQPFSVVIWITVSKDLDMQRVQGRIANRMNLKYVKGESVEDTAIRLLKRLKLEKKFLLILDDVWERIDLQKIGVPPHTYGTQSKIILTTRSREVCGEMKTDVDIKVDVLSEEEAWGLFVENTGTVVNLDHIESIARGVAKECCGLPLAIITVGRAMRRKTKVELWKDALRELRMSSSVPSIKGLEKDVFLPLKWSYDSLEGMNIRPCFLYCCLYPEDFSIDSHELVQCWIAEGLIGELENLDDLYNRGIALIETLKSSCLLEYGSKQGTVKMHDVVRDLAIWISNTVEVEKYKCLVRAGMGLWYWKIREMKTSNSLKRVSFMQNNIKILPDSVSQCSEVSTLLLKSNSSLSVVPEGFIHSFPELRVLNLSSTMIRSLPASFAELGDLCVLYLSHCNKLEDLSSLQGLTRLEMLDLSHTFIRNIPTEMKDLKSLRHFNLSHTTYLESISAGTISGMSSLEVLDMRFSKYTFDTGNHLTKGSATFQELLLPEHLVELCLTLDDRCIKMEAFASMKRFKRFFIGIGRVEYELSIPYNMKTIFIGQADLYGLIVGPVLANVNALVFQGCTGPLPYWWERHRASFTSLKSLAVDHCDWSHNLSNTIFLPNLEELYIREVVLTASRSDFMIPFGTNLKILRISECHQMVDVFPCILLDKLQNLREIEVSHCPRLTELVSGYKEVEPINSLPSLKVVKLKHLPKLNSVCNGVKIWPSIEHIEVEACRALKKLPLCPQHETTIKSLRGDLNWWNRLQWEDEDTKYFLQKHFKLLSQQVPNEEIDMRPISLYEVEPDRGYY